MERTTSALFATPADIGIAASVSAFDEFGVPQTRVAALSMTRADIEAAATRIIAHMDDAPVDEFLHESPRNDVGSVVLDSPQAVFAISYFNRAFGKRKLIKLSDVAEHDWSSLDALVCLIADSLDARRGLAA